MTAKKKRTVKKLARDAGNADECRFLAHVYGVAVARAKNDGHWNRDAGCFKRGAPEFVTLRRFADLVGLQSMGTFKSCHTRNSVEKRPRLRKSQALLLRNALAGGVVRRVSSYRDLVEMVDAAGSPAAARSPAAAGAARRMPGDSPLLRGAAALEDAGDYAGANALLRMALSGEE